MWQKSYGPSPWIFKPCASMEGVNMTHTFSVHLSSVQCRLYFKSNYMPPIRTDSRSSFKEHFHFCLSCDKSRQNCITCYETAKSSCTENGLKI